MSAYIEYIGDTIVSIVSDDSTDRRSRGAQVGALARWLTASPIGGVSYRLANPRATYSETHGFLSRTRITYDLVRKS